MEDEINAALWLLHDDIAEAVADAYVELHGLGVTDAEITARLGIPDPAV